jgi:hypothetical protein
MDDLRRQVEELLGEVALLRQQLAERDARIAELEFELKRRGKRFTPKANAKKAAKKSPDRRKKPHRKHSGVFREPPVADENTIDHDVRLECCPHCGCEDLQDTGDFDEHFVEDIPEPKVELHRYRRHLQKCRGCGPGARGGVIWNCRERTSARVPDCWLATAALTWAFRWKRPTTCSGSCSD